MTSAYGHAWTSVHGTTPQNPESGALTVDGDTWSKALAGITPQQLGAGLDACLAEGAEFPPAAGRFRGMCLGIPVFERVRLEVQRPDAERSPFTRLTWSLVDGYRHRQSTASQADALLRDAYALASEHVMRGQPLPSDDPALPKPGSLLPVGIPEDRAARCERMRQLLGDDYNPAVEDPAYDPVKARAKADREAAERAIAELRQDSEQLP